MQYVRVELAEGRVYTYGWDDDLEPALERGEWVILPGNVVHKKPFPGRVNRSLGDDPQYDGQIQNVIGRLL